MESSGRGGLRVCVSFRPEVAFAAFLHVRQGAILCMRSSKTTQNKAPDEIFFVSMRILSLFHYINTRMFSFHLRTLSSPPDRSLLQLTHNHHGSRSMARALFVKSACSSKGGQEGGKGGR